MINIIKNEVIKQEWTKAENKYLYMDEIVYMNKAGRDADNLKKLTQDSITESGVVWTDDTYCLPRTQKILIDKNNPRVELEIFEVDYIGIYNSNDDYNTFLNTYCIDCTKYTNNCVLLRESLEGRINPEITHIDDCFICTKYKKKKEIKTKKKKNRSYQ